MDDSAPLVAEHRYRSSHTRDELATIHEDGRPRVWAYPAAIGTGSLPIAGTAARASTLEAGARIRLHE